MTDWKRRSRWAAPLMAVALLCGFAVGCSVEQTEEGELPAYEVEQTEEGNLPEYDVDAADVEVTTDEETITVPDVDVDVEPPQDEEPDA